MKKFTVIIPKELIAAGIVDKFKEMLPEFGVTAYDTTTTVHEDYGVTFRAHMGEKKFRLMNIFLEHLSPEVPINFYEVPEEFSFSHHYGTLLAESNVEKIILNMLGQFNELIDTTLKNHSVEYQQDARVKVAAHCKYFLDQWGKK